jgi:hypothetical protein
VTDPPREPASQDPIRLDYFAAQDPDRRRTRAMIVFSVLLIAGWAPFACGVISRLAIVRSGSAETIGSHETGAILLMAAGVVASLVALVGFARMRHLVASLVAVGVVGVQIVMAMCMGFAWI